MCPHGYHHSGSMATPALGTRDVRLHIVWIALWTGLAWLVLFNDIWSQEGHLMSCMTILFTSKCKSSDQTSGHT